MFYFTGMIIIKKRFRHEKESLKIIIAKTEKRPPIGTVNLVWLPDYTKIYEPGAGAEISFPRSGAEIRGLLPYFCRNEFRLYCTGWIAIMKAGAAGGAPAGGRAATLNRKGQKRWSRPCISVAEAGRKLTGGEVPPALRYWEETVLGWDIRKKTPRGSRWYYGRRYPHVFLCVCETERKKGTAAERKSVRLFRFCGTQAYAPGRTAAPGEIFIRFLETADGKKTSWEKGSRRRDTDDWTRAIRRQSDCQKKQIAVTRRAGAGRKRKKKTDNKKDKRQKII